MGDAMASRLAARGEGGHGPDARVKVECPGVLEGVSCAFAAVDANHALGDGKLDAGMNSYHEPLAVSWPPHAIMRTVVSKSADNVKCLIGRETAPLCPYPGGGITLPEDYI
jgi:hypothetical protein